MPVSTAHCRSPTRLARAPTQTCRTTSSWTISPRVDDAAAGYVGGERVLAAGTVYRRGVLDVALLAKNLGAHPDDAVAAKVVLASVTSTSADGTSRSAGARSCRDLPSSGERDLGVHEGRP